MEIKKILIAEDEAIIALDIKTTLRANLYSVVGTARSYNGVVKRINEHSPDLLISSLLLKKDKDYFEKIVHLQNQHNFSVLFLSGVMDLSSFKDKCNPDSVTFLKKPFDPTALLSSINYFNSKLKSHN